MTVVLHINALLHRHDCVIIPDFGAILTHKVSAQIHETTNTFYPPKKVLAFNEQLNQNDGLLANHIAKCEDCSYSEAIEQIKLFTLQISNSIKEQGSYSIKHIGVFSLNIEGRLVFKPNYLNNFLVESFGLSHFTSEPTSRILSGTDEVTPVIPLQQSINKSNKKIYLKYASIGLISLFIGGTIGSKLYINQIESSNKITYEKASKEVDRKIQEATFVLTSPIPSATLQVGVREVSKPFHIIAGAFKNNQNAINKINYLHQIGFINAKSIGLNRFGLNQIAYDSFETREEALTALSSIRAEDNKNAWLFIDPSK